MTAAGDAALAPARAWMHRHAQDQAAAILAGARREADAIIAAAQTRASATVTAAQEAGRRDAADLAAAERARARLTARSVLLAARRDALDELRARVHAEMAGLPGGPGYARLIAGLRQRAAAAAGAGAVLTVPPGGGVIARSEAVVVDCSLPRLADLAIAALGPQVRQLWTR
jgi:ATP synthase (E/31 kDa) subunit